MPRQAYRFGSASMGQVSVIFITDKQFGMIQNCEGNLKRPTDEKPSQLALFWVYHADF